MYVCEFLLSHFKANNKQLFFYLFFGAVGFLEMEGIGEKNAENVKFHMDLH